MTTFPTHHLLRRRARTVADRYNASHAYGGWKAVVLQARRGPFRWRVELHKRLDPLD